MDLYNLKMVYKNMLDKMRQLSTFTSPFDKKQSEILKRLMDDDRIVDDDIYRLGLLTNFRFSQESLLFDKLKPWSGSPIEHLCLTNKSAPREWWFFYGVASDGGSNPKPTYPQFMVCLLRIGLSRDVSIYNLFLGYTDSKQNWISPSSSYGQLTMSWCVDNSGEYNYIGFDSATNPHQLRVKTASDGGIDCTYIEGYGDTPTFAFSLGPEVGRKAVAYYNGDGGCDPICFDGVGSLYWSFTNLKFSSYTYPNQTDVTPPDSSWGWFDHQLASVGTPFGGIGRVIQGLTQLNFTPTRWLWTTAKISDDLQYQIYTKITKYPVKKGDVFDCKVNRYNSGKATYKIDGKTLIVDTTTIDSKVDQNIKFDIPISYTMTFEDKSYTFLDPDAATKSGIVYLNAGVINLEKGGMWTDNNTGATGLAFLEANNFHKTKDQTKLINKMGGFNLSDKDIDHLEPGLPVSPGKTYFLVIFITILVVFLVAQSICAFKKDGGKSKWWCCKC